MSSPPCLGLLAAGPVSRSPLAQEPALLARLGPVKAGSLRVASRFVNRLRAGHAVPDWGGLEPCAVLLVCVPDREAEAAARSLAESGLSWRGRTVAVWSDRLCSAALRPLAERGAATASLMTLHGMAVLEGAAKALRPLFAGRNLELEPGRKPLFLAALRLSGALQLPRWLAAQECLRGAGLSRTETDRLLQRQAETTLRAFLKAGRPMLSQAATPSKRERAALAAAYPLAVALYDEGMEALTKRG